MSFKFRSLKDTYIGEIVNANRMLTQVTGAMTKAEDYRLTKDQLNLISSDIKSKISVSGKQVILDDLESGHIDCLYVPGLNLTGWAINNGKDYTGIANLFGKIKIRDKYSFSSYQPREVFGVLMYAHVQRKYAENYNKLVYSTPLLTNAAIVYTRMVMRVIDSMYATASIPVQSAAISYSIAKFFLSYVVERDHPLNKETRNSIAMQVAKQQSSIADSAIAEFGTRFNDENLVSLPRLFAGLAESYTVVKDLDVNTFIRKMITMYGEKSLFMIELLSGFLGYTICSAYSSNLIKDFIFESVSGKEGLKIANLFLDLTKN
jgi:hypothetical protein